MIDEKFALQSAAHPGYGRSAEWYGTDTQQPDEHITSIEGLSASDSAVAAESGWTARRLVSLGTLGTAACLALLETQTKLFSQSSGIRRIAAGAGLTSLPPRVDPALRSMRTESLATHTHPFGSQPLGSAFIVPTAMDVAAPKKGSGPPVQRRFDEEKGKVVEDDGIGYHPEFWNSGEVRRWNNCYNYATNRQTDTFAQPGRGARIIPHRYETLKCETVDMRAKADGLRPHACAMPCPDSTDMHVFLAVAPDEDFHWYREHKDTRKWSHKRGPLPVADTDLQGEKIDVPNRADRGPYTDACGCYCVPETATIIVAKIRVGCPLYRTHTVHANEFKIV